MSVHIVQKGLIDILVSALVDDANKIPKAGQVVIFGASQAEQDKIRKWCDQVGTQLWDVNYDSFNRRYGKKNPTPEYAFEPDHRAPAEILAAVDLYESQTWESTTPRAHEASETLRRLYTRKLPEVQEATAKLVHLA